MADIERITVSLLRQASTALTSSAARGGLSKTDTVNRAITLYDFITGRVEAGDDIVLQHSDGSREVVRFL